MIFQIRDDIFDYYDSKEIGKPTGNDMAEGKLTLPAIYAVEQSSNVDIKRLATKVKKHTVTPEEIKMLVEYTKSNGGIEYAERRMAEMRKEAMDFINNEVTDSSIADALTAYLDFVIERNK